MEANLVDSTEQHRSLPAVWEGKSEASEVDPREDNAIKTRGQRELE
jgi:hypothetical protein